ncbi:MAG: zinc dependent phospholipase C family protein [Candidatus Latescibacterota bacterium]|nr:zinc dependent phospholipase C family protein [Candidatus Latescibacterota bacterium]
MAGSYLHLLIADDLWPRLFYDLPGDGTERASFLGGVLGPDIGFFPGGPRTFSERVHHEHTADLVHALQAAANGPAERCFAAGWALHVYTDVAIHPLVNDRADVLRRALGRHGDTREDLYHKRVEWGLDCHSIESDPHHRFPWRFPLSFPPSLAASLLGRTATRFFGSEASEDAFAAGWKTTQRWVRRIGPIFVWTGSCRPVSAGVVSRVIGKGIGGLTGWAAQLPILIERPEWEDEVAIASPVEPDLALVAEVTAATAQMVEEYIDGWHDDFSGLRNFDLDNGELIAVP